MKYSKIYSSLSLSLSLPASFFLGKVLISELFQNEFSQLHPKTLATYLQLLQKFEVAMKISKEEVIIPSLMPEEGRYPQPNDSLKDVDMSEGVEDAYQPTIRRFWLSNYIPDGFWPRLICRIIKDHQVKEVLDKYIDNTHCVTSTLFSDGFDWRLWKTGIAFVSRGRTLMLIHQVENVRGGWGEGRVLPGNHRLEVHIYAGEMVRVIDELREQDRSQFPGFESSDDSYLSPYVIIGHATRLMVDVCNHIVSLSAWFQGMFLHFQKLATLPNVGYIPCWKCYGEIKPMSPLKRNFVLSKLGEAPSKVSSEQVIFLHRDSKPVFAMLFNDCIVPAVKGKDLFCPVHGPLKTLHVAPDLVSLLCVYLTCTWASGLISKRRLTHGYRRLCVYTFVNAISRCFFLLHVTPNMPGCYVPSLRSRHTRWGLGVPNHS